MKLVIKTLFGLEKVLAEEVKSLGGENIYVGNRMVSCEGDLQLVYSANYELRTALKVLLPIYQFKAKDEASLYRQVYDFDWTNHLDQRQTFALDQSIFSEYFKHSKFASLKVKDAIVDQFRAKLGARPSVDVNNPDLLLNVHGFKDQFNISIDTSGDSLNMRGYREKGHRAPLNEVLAAGMLRIAGWPKDKTFIDFMCGSGTLLLEAAMMSLNIPPQILRKDFALKRLMNFNPLLWNKVKTTADNKIRKTSIVLHGSDVDPVSIRLAKTAAKKLGVMGQVKLRPMKFQDVKPNFAEAFLITNPPYGERIGKEIDQLYKDMGDQLKHYFKNGEAWIMSSNQSALKQLRLRPDVKIELKNGALRCEFCQYHLF
jgi:putative N6-adenine-specific DNA methylase